MYESESESHSVVSDSLWPRGLYSPWNSPGQNTGVCSLSFLQGIFPTQGLNPGLPHCRQILYQLSHKGSPGILEQVAYPFSKGSSRPRNWTGVSCIAGGFFTNWPIREASTWVVCCSLLQWITFCQNCSLRPICLEWPCPAWLMASLSYVNSFTMTRLWSMKGRSHLRSIKWTDLSTQAISDNCTWPCKHPPHKIESRALEPPLCPFLGSFPPEVPRGGYFLTLSP